MACNIVVPIALFGTILWILNDKNTSIRAIEEMLPYGGKRVQRLLSKASNICALFGLRWVRFERFIENEKVTFHKIY